MGNVAGGVRLGRLWRNNATGSLSIQDGNLDLFRRSAPVGGSFTYTPSASNYIQIGSNKYPPQLPAAKVLHGTAHGNLTGTLAASNIGTATGTTNLSAAILKSGEHVDDVTGTLSTSTSANGGRIGLGL